jgi:transketolase
MEPKTARLAVNTIKMLAVDAIEKANSGHPGLPMGAADYAFVLWNRYLRYSAQKPLWPNRDRFVLSGGHGSTLLYSLLHLAGFDLALDELKNFRQWGSKTPGHPEFGETPGVEATTGPLGQGLGNGVGMAIAAKMMASRFNRNDFSPIDHRVYVIATDGDMMEGVASEAASLAGHLKLSNLIVIYDDNRITLDGPADWSFSENVPKRFESYGWATQSIDGHDHAQIARALDKARATTDRPSLISARTHIGEGAPHKHDTSEVHGSPLGPEETKGTKEALGWPLSPTFLVPAEVRALFAERSAALENERKSWEEGLARWRKNHPDLSELWNAHWEKRVPDDLYARLLETLPKMPNATRSAGGEIYQTTAELVPALIGGAADLVSSTKTEIKKSTALSAADFSGRNFHFGIREHGMGAIQNGLAQYGSFIPLGSTFLVFSDYMRGSIRLAALSKLQTVYVFTHDSVFLGEDGPTHQPIEQLSALRLIPNLAVVRPADSLECAGAWEIALSRKKGPTAICLTRQKLPSIERDRGVTPQEILKGGYIVAEASGLHPEVVIAATGSELHLAIGAKKLLDAKGIATRVVSMPCLEAFAGQSDEYRNRILPRDVRAVAIEAGSTDLWHKWIGKEGLGIGMERFGASAPDTVLAEKFGFTAPQIANRIEGWL